MRRATITDVAKLAGVSKATVSHVINDTRFVEPATRQRVLEAIDELGYQPSLIARSLITNNTKTIGLIVSNISNVFFGEILNGIEEITRPAGYSIIICNTNEILEREEFFIDLLLRQRVDGIIAAAVSQYSDTLSKVSTQHTPIVYVDRLFEDLEGAFVSANNYKGAYDGTEHIISHGHTEIGVLAGFLRLSTMRDRLAGFKDCLESHSIQVTNEWLVESSLQIESAKEVALQLLSRPDRPSALLANNNMLSLGALLAIHELKLRCPEDISIVGFDDHPWAVVSHPPLTVIRQPSRLIGTHAAELLFSLINNEKVEKNQILLDCELVIRESVGKEVKNIHKIKT